jgi:hypothetical protein
MRLCLPPVEWERITGVLVLDDDGWRCDAKSWKECLSREEFLNRAANSTTRYPPGFFDALTWRQG